MTQLTLFSDLTTSLAPAAPVVAPVVAPTSSAAEAPQTGGEKKSEQDTLLKLATLIRDGRAQIEAQSRSRSRPVQSIGDLAQSVLLRHDLVARRRAVAAENRAAAVRDEVACTVAAPNAAATRVPAVGLVQTPAQVHVAS
ncbi:hypothetical protein [Aporhodopirellula aestuarii]|uniref:Secreted protein n=1 Tax=Aporhodopirellula aestuarii TaxID=2950107 RepID=A0ABT0U6Q4_9BACT|nr:hypothetical protein [Aporhodopirellula aestuarii]MCM2372220.1 hypothetical protein [Aporhodopirellula aestuarii]